jgi:hypothetical protein
MKTRIVLTLALLVGATFLERALFHPVEAIAKNSVAVSTVNGGDAAFVAQQAVHSASALGHVLVGFAVLAALVTIWFPAIKKLWNADPIINSEA